MLNESHFTACMDCMRGPKCEEHKSDACSAGWRARTRKMGCYGGPRIPGTKARKGEQGYIESPKTK